MTMLVPIRVLTLLMLLILIAQSLSSHTSSYQGSTVATKRCNFVPNREGNIDGVHALSGRKLAYTEEMKENITIEENKQQQKSTANVKGREMNEEKKTIDGYVAFTADYKSPRHHPPKNN
ncbi:hypothetical protein RND71_023569 [Anisodus tanguticus]|uniref:Uncharacterized protein n=1 Tax=Anisodus tanguticus TaxID=243964 RepID=A0AAE1RSU4_9SOLA|nr:hypothetical protein RND71_023569 [Anisodus tanguticus]